ncbi:hypothetical protein BCR43DRAFT_522571 [Syncephalastrum racemosum]|uniref:F-box domain-containing protein n=1 Tax=Syncephalastrum racemosum TaxID=13706 RepID=A0A1X2HSB8_SYNRA|nr:hypothetical protein BCR43DRAFT_522571 [Syncephalastrum racemosum]
MTSVLAAFLYLVSSNRRSLEVHPSSSLDLLPVGQHLYRTGQYQDAYKLFSRLQSFAVEQHPSKRTELMLTCLRYRIRALAKLDRLHTALQLLAEAADLHLVAYNTSCSTQWCLLAGELYELKGDHIRALAWLHRASSAFDTEYPLLESNTAQQLEARSRILEQKVQVLCQKERGRSVPSMAVDFVQVLPYDTICDIFHRLPFADLVLCMRVSRRWYMFIHQSLHLWQSLEFDGLHRPVQDETFRIYLTRLHGAQLKHLKMHNPNIDGDILFRSLIDHRCCRLQTLDVSEVVCTPALFLRLLDDAGSTLKSLRWGGLSLRLDALVNHISVACKQLEQLTVHDCFASVLPKVDSIQAELAYHKSNPNARLVSLKSLSLLNIHSLEFRHLFSLLSRSPRLERLHLQHSMVNIESILLVLRLGFPSMKHLEFTRHQNARPHHVSIPRSLAAGRLTETQQPWQTFSVKGFSALTDSTVQWTLARSHASLERLELNYNTVITSHALATLASRPKPKLHTLSLAGCFLLSTSCLRAMIATSPNVQDVDLSNLLTVDDSVLSQLAASCPRLKRLDVSKCVHVTDKGVQSEK